MKKTKLLMPLAGVAALGAVTPVIMTTASCKKAATISDLVITLDATEVPNIYVGTTVNKSQFKVDAKMSDGTTKENVSGWTCDKFDNEGNFTFSTTKAVEFTFVYEKFEKKVSYTATKVADARFVSDEYTVNIDNASTSTSARLTIVSKGTVMILDPTLFNWTSSEPEWLEIDGNAGIVSAKKYEASTTKEVTVSAKYKDDTEGTAITCKVNVVCTDSTIEFDTDTDTLQIDKGFAQNNVYTVPRIVTKNNLKYTVKVIGTGETTPVDDITTLILPATLEGIREDTFASCNLQNIYYNGTQADWMEQVYYQTEDNWAGDLPIGVECTDGMLLFDDRYGTTAYNEVQGTTVGKYLALDNTIGAFLSSKEYTVRFDYSELGLTNVADARKVKIRAYTNGILWQTAQEITINSVYIDGVKATSTIDYQYTNNELEFLENTGGTSTAQLKVDSVVTVKFNTPAFHIRSNIHMAAANIDVE